MLDQGLKDAALAQLRQLTYRPKVVAPDPVTPPRTRNALRLKGLARQGKQESLSCLTYRKKTRPPRHNENQIHDFLVDNPFLLFTPKLFEGGLFLDSIISRMPITRSGPMGKDERRVPDFVYLTLSGEAIKITLVEIESPAQRLFVKQGARLDIHSDAMKGLEQVREWREWMQEPDTKSRLLGQVSSLLESYPYPLFDSNGAISPYISVEVDYFLVVGTDQPETLAERAVLDRIYVQDGIVVMSYPMMIEAVSERARPCNALKKQTKGFDAEHVWAPDKLLNYAPGVRVPDYQGHLEVVRDDKDRVQMMALGHPFGYRKRPDNLPHPSARLALSLRCAGRCEYPGCDQILVGDDGFSGANIPWRGEDDMLTDSIRHVENQIMVCREHRDPPGYKELYLRRFNPAWASIARRKGGYDWRLDMASQVTTAKLLPRNINAFMQRFSELSPLVEPTILEDLRTALLKTSQLPYWESNLLAGMMVNAQPDFTCRMFARLSKSRRRETLDLLERFSAIQVTERASDHYIYVQKVFSNVLAGWIIETFPRNYDRIFCLICQHKLPFLLIASEQALQRHN